MWTDIFPSISSKNEKNGNKNPRGEVNEKGHLFIWNPNSITGGNLQLVACAWRIIKSCPPETYQIEKQGLIQTFRLVSEKLGLSCFPGKV